MSKYKVLTDGNGSDLIQVVGLGVYAPLSRIEKLTAERDELLANKLPEDYIAVPESAWHQLVQCELERDSALAQNAELAAQVDKLMDRNRKLDVDLLRALFYAPSSPVSAGKAHEIEVWYGKFKQVHLASKGGE